MRGSKLRAAEVLAGLVVSVVGCAWRTRRSPGVTEIASFALAARTVILKVVGGAPRLTLLLGRIVGVLGIAPAERARFALAHSAMLLPRVRRAKVLAIRKQHVIWRVRCAHSRRHPGDRRSTRLGLVAPIAASALRRGQVQLSKRKQCELLFTAYLAPVAVIGGLRCGAPAKAGLV
eukprot:7377023-Prymnesium_polylepis.1